MIRVHNALTEIAHNVGTGGQGSFETAHDRAGRVSAVYAEARDKILPVMNAAAVNTIDAGLKRVLILQETVRDFAIRVLPARLFSTIFENVPLQGTDTVECAVLSVAGRGQPISLQGDNAGGGGYQFGQATNTNSKVITVNKRKYQPLDYWSRTSAASRGLTPCGSARSTLKNSAWTSYSTC